MCFWIQYIHVKITTMAVIFSESLLGTGSKSQIGSHFCKYLLTINDLYNGAKIVYLSLAVVEI